MRVSGPGKVVDVFFLENISHGLVGIGWFGIVQQDTGLFLLRDLAEAVVETNQRSNRLAAAAIGAARLEWLVAMMWPSYRGLRRG